jgi:hypothetical protein
MVPPLTSFLGMSLRLPVADSIFTITAELVQPDAPRGRSFRLKGELSGSRSPALGAFWPV